MVGAQVADRECIQRLATEQVRLAGLAVGLEVAPCNCRADRAGVAEAQVAGGFVGRQPLGAVQRHGEEGLFAAGRRHSGVILFWLEERGRFQRLYAQQQGGVLRDKLLNVDRQDGYDVGEGRHETPPGLMRVAGPSGLAAM